MPSDMPNHTFLAACYEWIDNPRPGIYHVSAPREFSPSEAYQQSAGYKYPYETWVAFHFALDSTTSWGGWSGWKISYWLLDAKGKIRNCWDGCSFLFYHFVSYLSNLGSSAGYFSCSWPTDALLMMIAVVYQVCVCSRYVHGIASNCFLILLFSTLISLGDCQSSKTKIYAARISQHTPKTK